MAKGRVAAAVVAIGSVAGAATLWFRRAGKSKERVEVYYADGSMVTFTPDSEEAGRLFPIGRRILSQARS
jgi:hypothetical protein